MKRYLKNLLSALLGNNPYRAELDEMAAKLEQAGDNFRGLQGLYYNMVERWEADLQHAAALIGGRKLTTYGEQQWFPVAVLPGQSTFTMNFTSGKFDTNLFSMANAIKDKEEFAEDHAWRTNSTYAMSIGERFTPDSAHQIELSRTPIANSIYIGGMELATGDGAPTSGHYKVDSVNPKLITFAAADDIDYVDVVYDYTQEGVEAIITNKEAAIGEAVCIWPVYGSGDDCTESDIIGYYIVKVFRARITQVPGMDTSLDTLRLVA